MEKLILINNSPESAKAKVMLYNARNQITRHGIFTFAPEAKGKLAFTNPKNKESITIIPTSTVLITVVAVTNLDIRTFKSSLRIRFSIFSKKTVRDLFPQLPSDIPDILDIPSLD